MQLQIAPNNLQRKKIKPVLHNLKYKISSTIKTHSKSKEPRSKMSMDSFSFYKLCRVGTKLTTLSTYSNRRWNNKKQNYHSEIKKTKKLSSLRKHFKII